LSNFPLGHHLLTIEAQFAKRERRLFIVHVTAGLSVKRHHPVGHTLLEHIDDKTGARIDGSPVEKEVKYGHSSKNK
jgi:hypothetical protein